MGKGCSQKRSSSTIVRKLQPTKRINGSTSTNKGEQLLTEISDWIVKQKANGKLVLQGRKSDDPSRHLWQSSSILKRVSSKCFMTTSKTVYKLVGNINAEAAKADGWPHHLITRYSEEIPARWRHLIQLHVDRNFRGNNYSESCMTYAGSYRLDSRCKSSEEPDTSFSPDDQVEGSFFSGIQLQNVALNLIRRNSLLFQSVNSTPRTRSSSQHMEINDDIISPIRTDSPQVTEGHGRVTRRNKPCPDPNTVRLIHLDNARNKRPTRSSFEPCEMDIIYDIPARSTPTLTIPVAAANKRLVEAENVRPVKRAAPVKMVPKTLFKLKECKVVLKQINPGNVIAKPVEEVVVAKNVKTKKSARLSKPRVKSRPMKTNKKKVETGKSGSLNVASVVPEKKLSSTKNVLECYEGITSKPGTLKHKQQMRQFLNECNNCPSDPDFLSQNLPKIGLNKMVGDFVAGDDFSVATDVSSSSEAGTPRRENGIMTPLSESGTPTSATYSPTYLHTINWKHVDKYMIQRKAEKKLKALRVLDKPVVKRKLKREFLDISLGKLKLIPIRTESDEENMETSCEES